MRNIRCALLLILIIVGSLKSFGQFDRYNGGQLVISEDEMRLYNLIMDYRKSQNLPKIPLSKKLTFVAQTHAKDSDINGLSNMKGQGCNMHSWSGLGYWESCCYLNDHSNAKCMWDKPRELTNYDEYGYEIAFFSSDNATPEEALAGWMKSDGHRNCIINQSIWKNSNWKAIGVGIKGRYAMVWFGEMADPDGEPKVMCMEK